jgi:hypothetical protein
LHIETLPGGAALVVLELNLAINPVVDVSWKHVPTNYDHPQVVFRGLVDAIRWEA